MNCNALVLAHYDFKNDKGQEIKTTKIRVSLGDYGTLDLCTNLADNYDLLSVLNVTIKYNEKKRKYVVTKVN